jgi:CheY-like chemotaxis protein
VPPRVAYVGTRRRVLVVDNEEVDRTLLARRLDASGFDVVQAGSGAAALGLLHEQHVDAILMDLAMPGIDGWETIRTLRRQRLSDAPVAVVSANAFDKGLENDAGISAADFITKPVRFDELLDWLGARLALQWHASARAVVPPPLTTPDSGPAPSREQLQGLQQVVTLGYPRGVQRLLDEIESARPECGAWLGPLRTLAAAFEFERMTTWIQDALAKTQPA